MEPSRDDFVIALRSAFLKRGTQQRFSLLSLILFSIILFTLSSLNFKVINYFKIGINELIYRGSFIASFPEKFIKRKYIDLQDHRKLFTNYKDNLTELDSIKSSNLSKELIEFENIRLKQMIDDYVVIDNNIFAKVLIDKKSPFLRSIIINKGSKNNIKLGMAVLDGIYFIGKVVEVNYSTSRILLISDINSKIPVSLEPIGVQAIMSGNGEMNGIIEYVNQPNLESENTNLTVFTSGMGGLFKSGIPIGKIIKEKNASNITSNVNFYKDLSQLKYVKILSYKKENLNLEIENSQDRNGEMLPEKNNQNYLLKEQKKISNEIRVKLEEDKILLNKELKKIKKELSKLKKNVQNQIIEDEKTLIDINELKFLKLNFLYAKKCTKTFYNKLYKVDSAKYKKCILNKGKN